MLLFNRARESGPFFIPKTQKEPKMSISEAQLNANRANAQFSTGPVSATGRATSSRNALKTGLTGRTVLLPTDDADEYNRRLENALAFHAPATEEEQTLVQSLIDTDWRLDRIVTLETGILLKGAIEFADAHQAQRARAVPPDQSRNSQEPAASACPSCGCYLEDQPAAHRKALIQAETYLKYEKPLRNLHIQEARLRRQRAKDLAELTRLQAERARQQAAAQKEAAAQKAQPKSHSANQPAAAPNGFEFATAENAENLGSNYHEDRR
jgi:hypothetical protein